MSGSERMRRGERLTAWLTDAASAWSYNDAFDARLSDVVNVDDAEIVLPLMAWPKDTASVAAVIACGRCIVNRLPVKAAVPGDVVVLRF